MFYIGNIGTHGIYDSGGIGTADVEVFLFALFLTGLDYIYRVAQGGPDVIIVHSGGHYSYQHFTGTYFGHRDLLYLEGIPGITEPLGSDELCMHFFWNYAYRRQGSYGYNFGAI